MPTTEVPSPPPVKDPKPDYELDGPRNTSDYGDLGTDELVQRINELEDERRAARIREGIWIALLLHALAVVLWIYGPRYILHRPVVVRPSLQNKDFTYFNMPQDALRQAHPRSAPPAHPTVDRKTLEHFQAMRKATPAPQQAAPQSSPAQPAPQQPVQQAQQQPPPPPVQTPSTAPAAQQPPAQQQAQATPQPAQQAPNPFKTDNSAGDMIRQATRGAASGSGNSAPNAPGNAGGMGAGASILSDTMGVNFDPWLQRVVAATYRSWLPIIPISAKPPLNDKGKVSIKFDVLPDGSLRIGSMSLMSPSGKVPLDRAAWAGITGATYPPLPSDFKGKSITLAFGFYYNIPPDEK